MTAVYNPALPRDIYYCFPDGTTREKKKRRVGIYIQTKTEKSGGSGI